MNKPIQSPFVWFGGKKKVAADVWSALGDVQHYIEPFFGSGAVLMRRPHKANCETINDADGLLANFWRAVKADPALVAHHAAHPVNECDLHARHLWLVNAKESITSKLMGDPEWFDAKAAGWWVWGVNCWIGSGFCSGDGPWQNIDGEFAKRDTGQGVNKQLPHLGNSGKGVNKQLPHLGNSGKGVNKKLPAREAFLVDWFSEISERLHGVRVACGDWSRVCGPSVLDSAGGICGVFLDPPYDLDMRTAVYANESSCAKDVLAWCAVNGDNPKLRIVLAGYEGEHNDLEALGWTTQAWKASGGYGGGKGGRGDENSHKERLWLSPHCIVKGRAGEQVDMFA